MENKDDVKANSGINALEALGFKVVVDPAVAPGAFHLVTLKDQPSGVVLPAKYADDTAYGQGRDDAIDEVARLNSSPVNSGDGMCNEDNPGARCICREEFGYRVCAPSAGGVDERAAFEDACPSISAKLQSHQRGSYDPADVEHAERNAAQEGWQARAALTTEPNHSEQVREGWQLVPIQATQEMIDAGFEEVPSRSYGDKYKSDADRVYDAMLAAAPSAASAPGECVAVPDGLHGEAERCAFVLENIGSMDAEDIDGDDIDLRFEDAEGRDTGCDVSIVEYAERGAKVIRALLAQQGKAVGDE